MAQRLFHRSVLLRIFTALGFMVFVCLTTCGSETLLDVVIRGGMVIDGTGNPRYIADVGVSDGRVSFIGTIKSERARSVIDATGLVVAPGFIDMMGQTASPMLESDRSAINLLTQGITTINAGEGASAAPLSRENAKRAGYATMREYFALLEMKGLPVNLVQTVGHTQIRRLVLGEVERRPSSAELEKMKHSIQKKISKPYLYLIATSDLKSSPSP